MLIDNTTEQSIQEAVMVIKRESNEYTGGERARETGCKRDNESKKGRNTSKVPSGAKSTLIRSSNNKMCLWPVS